MTAKGPWQGCLPGCCPTHERLQFLLFVILAGAVIDTEPLENTPLRNETKPHVSMEMRGGI